MEQTMLITCELMMSEDEALDLLLEMDGLTDAEMFLLESMESDDSLLTDEMVEVRNGAIQRLMLLQACPPTNSQH
jgi:hypothetical protein